MQDYLKKRTLFVAFVFFIEIIALGLVFVFKQTDILKDYLQDILICLIVAFMLFNLLIVFISFAHISKAKVKSDITAIDVVGHDMQGVYDFGQIGILIVDENDKIIWTNDWISNSQNLFIDKDVFSCIPDLIKTKRLNSENETERVVVSVEGRQYEATYKKEASMYILKDVSNLESVTTYNINHSPAIGIIAIDNYIDLTGVIDEIILNDLLSSVQRLIVDYARKYDICLRKYRSDSYLAICTNESFQKMIADKFSIVQDVKSIESEYEITISIGFAAGFDDFVKLSDMAASSLDLAFSRGGDQAVIFPYGKNYIFFGGKSEAKLKRNQTRTRVLSQSLTAIIKASEDVYVMGHDFADLDAIGSSLGLYCFAGAFNKTVKIIYDENKVENKTRRAFKQSFSKDEIKEMTITSQEAIKNIKKNSLLILTDVHRPSMCMAKDIVDKFTKVAVIDHHRRSEEFVNKPIFVHIEPSASSASELVTELIRYSQTRIELSNSIATMMLAGILLDTNYYRNKTGSITYSASLVLKDYGADNQIADSFLKEDYSEYALKTKIRANSETPYTGIVISVSDDGDIVEKSMLAIVAQETLAIQGIKACFVVGRIGENEIGISSRSDGTVNCQRLMEKLPSGSGGGHFAAAAVQFKDKTVSEVYNELKDVLEQHLNDAMSTTKGVIK